MGVINLSLVSLQASAYILNVLDDLPKLVLHELLKLQQI